MKIRKLFRVIGTSNEPVRTSNYVRSSSLQGYECGMQYDAHECLLQLLAKIYPIIIDDCMFKTNKLESTLCNDCGHGTNNDGVCIDLSLHLEDSSNIQTISQMLHQIMDPRGEYLENCRCVDGCQKLNASTKAVYVTQLSDALIIQPNIFKCSDGIIKKVVPNVSIDEEILLWGNRTALSGIIYHEGKQSHCGHYTSGVKVNDTWFLIIDTRILRKQKLLCSSKDSSVPYILIYQKITKFLTALPNSVNVTAEVGPTPELNTKTAEIVVRQSVLQELEKQKTKLTIVQEEEKPNPSKVKCLVKRKSEFTNRSSKENDKKREKLMLDNISDERKEHLKKKDSKRKKEKRDNLNLDEKEQLRTSRRKERKLCLITLMMNKKDI